MTKTLDQILDELAKQHTEKIKACQFATDRHKLTWKFAFDVYPAMLKQDKREAFEKLLEKK